jgi:2-polyprenyl-6-methoxyphenol hydroxylase-like FAD-dependent oxidoreductase
MLNMETDMKETRPVLIVGAGPTGLTAAMELARFGVPVRLVDQYTAPPDTSRAIAVQSRTVELMQQRGLAEEMLKLGNKGFAATLHDGKAKLGKVDLHHIDSRFNFVLLLSQCETERIVREQVERAGVRVERETQLVDFSQMGSGVQATLRKADGTLEKVEAAYLIDAEGAHSTVRHSMHLAFEGNSLPNTYALADLYLDGDVPEDELSIFIPESGLLAAFPMGNRRFRIIATEKHPVAQDAPALDLDAIQAAWSHAVSIPVRFRDLKWSSRFRINSRALKQLRHGRIFFAGDSAHIHSPAGGQGMNTGIQDVINLGWKLAMVYQGLAADALLDTYDEERLPIIHQLVSTTERATEIANADSRFVHMLLAHVVPLALHFDFVRRKGAGIVSELAANYRGSSLNGNNERNGPLHTGNRFPDAAVSERGEARVLDILDPSRLTVLLLGGADAAATLALARYRDVCVARPVAQPSAALLAALGDATVAVVRPDGYLLCAGGPAFVRGQLDNWFARWMTGAPD